MSVTRYVLIDDTNPGIAYSGPWFEVTNTQIDTGVFGPPFQNTLHGVNVTANLTFPFNGSEVFVYGTYVIPATGLPPAVTVECLVDFISIGGPPADDSENNWLFCGTEKGQFQLQDGLHFLTVQVNMSDLNTQPFWFDRIQYAPSTNVSLNQPLLRIDSTDTAIQYSPGWQSMNSLLFQVEQLGLFFNASFTQTPGTSLTYQFSGTSIIAFGTTQNIDITSMASAVTATYAIDDQDPIIFIVPCTGIGVNFYNQMLFEANNLSPGNHTLVIEYRGNNVTTPPLLLNYFVQQATQLSFSPPPSPSPPFVFSSSPTFHRKPTVTIIGGVISVFLISLLLSLP